MSRFGRFTHGVRSAAAAGMMTVMVPDLLEPTDEIRRVCAFIARDLHEVRHFFWPKCRPDFWAGSTSRPRFRTTMIESKTPAIEGTPTPVSGTVVQFPHREGDAHPGRATRVQMYSTDAPAANTSPSPRSRP
jgi:hypothetical protein